MDLERHASPAATDALARMSWHTFEHLLAEYYREQGWRVEYDSRPRSLKALGTSLDLRMRRGDEVTIVQCRQWDAKQVGVDEVNELLATMLNEGVSGGVLLTRGTFTPEARTAQRRQPRLQLVDGDTLRVMLKLPDPSGRVPQAPLAADTVRRTTVPRAAARRDRPWLVPAIVGALVVCLLGVFVWRAMAPRKPPAPPVTVEAAPAPAPVAAPAASPAAAPLPPPRRPAVDPSESLSRELAERARAQDMRSEAARREAHRQADDAIKVMERNTREIGSAE